jgi:hypothetical protein
MRSNDRDAGSKALIPWVLGAAILVVAASSCSNDASAPTSSPTTAPSEEPSAATSPTATPSPGSGAKELGISSEVGGWIAYGNDEGIWAVNPTPGDSRSDRIQLSERPGEPLAWSSDGSKLLFRSLIHSDDLFVLNADGTEISLTDARHPITGGLSPFSPDGGQIAYFEGGGDWGNSLRVMNADGSGVGC